MERSTASAGPGTIAGGWGGGKLLGASVGLAIGYLAAAVIGLRFAIPPGNATAIWPASGIAMAGVVLFGPYSAAGIWLGATLANLTTGVSLPIAAVIGCGNTLEALAGAWFLRRAGRRSTWPFQSAGGALLFAAAVAGASAVAASVGVAAVQLGSHLPLASVALNWLTWWLGDVAGIVILLPFLLAIGEARLTGASEHRWAEAAMAATVLAVVSLALFGGLLRGRDAMALLYLPLFVLIWLALRFPLAELTASTVLMTIIAAWGTSRGMGVFGEDGTVDSLLHVQLFMISFAITSLAVFGTVSKRREAEAAGLRSRNSLARTVSERTRDLVAANDALRRESAQRERLEEAERLRLATALESAGEGVVITDPAGTITYVNPAFEFITGYTRDEVVGKNPRVFQSGRHDPAFYQKLWRTISSGAVWRGSFVDRKRDSSFYDVESTIAPVREANGSLLGYVAVNRDVTVQKRAERALRDSESRLRAILENAADGIVTFHDNGLVESANPAAGVIFGQSPAGMLGRHVSALLPAPDPGDAGPLAERYLRLADAGRRPSLWETTGMRRDGKTIPLDVAFVEVPLGDRCLLAGFMHDATERHARLDAERTLLKATEELRVARAIQERFYPRIAPRIPGLDIAGRSVPAQHAGGDYFDYLAMRGGSLGVVVGDVMGHGLGAALLMSQARAYLHALVDQSNQVGDLVTRLNFFLAGDWAEEHFVTMFLVRIDSGGRSFEYASAGHQCYLMRSGGQVEVLTATGIPLGMMPREVPAAATRSLDPGDLLILLTDGIEEAQSAGGRELGRERVMEVVRTHRHRPAAEIVEALVSAAKEFADGKPQDDITAVVVKTLAQGRDRSAVGEAMAARKAPR